jgi:hypothetical protein
LRFPSAGWPSEEDFRTAWANPEGPGDGSTAEGWIHLYGPLTSIGRQIEAKKAEGFLFDGRIYLTHWPPGHALIAHAIMIPRPRGEDAERFRKP